MTFSSSTCPRWSKMTILSKILKKWQFWAKSLIGPTFLEKLKFSSSTCPHWSKLTILSKILDWANIFGKIDISILAMSAVVKNDNFEQAKLLIGPTFLEKLKFSSSTYHRWSKMTILSKILHRANIFGKIDIFIIYMSGLSAVVKIDNFEQNLGLGDNFWAKSCIGPTFLEKLKFWY